MSGLSAGDFWVWMGLRRIRRGGLARYAGRYFEQGRPVPGFLLPDLVEALLETGSIELGEPDEVGMQRVRVTEAGQSWYLRLDRQKRRQQRGRELSAPPPEFARSATEVPAGPPVGELEPGFVRVEVPAESPSGEGEQPSGRPSGRGCPGGCGRSIRPVDRACFDCWNRIPRALRHEAKLGDDCAPGTVVALQWLRDHPTVSGPARKGHRG